MTAKRERRVLLAGDTHCGHLVGLTHPTYQMAPRKSRTKRDKWATTQRECWAAFDKALTAYDPIDVVLWHGDMVDGKGRRSGSAELITASLEEQADMAVAVSDHVRLHCRKGVKMRGVYGTAYHVSTEDGNMDVENIVADRAGWDAIGAHDWVDVDGVVFDYKHHIGSSSIPHGRATAIKREDLWNALWHEHDLQPRAACLTRGHVHYYEHSDGFRRGRPFHVSTLPALQAMGTRYGGRRCSGLIQFGVVLVTVKGGVVTGWHPMILDIQAHKAQAVSV